MLAERWEHGSDFAYPTVDALARVPSDGEQERRAPWWPSNASYWHSGRDALRALVRTLEPRRVFFPSFYCQDVLDAAGHVEARTYPDGPEDLTIERGPLDELCAGDLLVVTNTYGLRRRSPVERALPDGVVVVEDHTHDPLSRWAGASTAAYAFASLRKWLPLPDGAVLWSPANLPVADAPPFDPRAHARAAAITLERLSGMLLKERYLAGEDVAKDVYRALATAAEDRIGRDPEPAPMSPVSRALLDVLPLASWHAARARNHRAFVDAFRPDTHPAVRVLTKDDDAAPFAIALCFDEPSARDAVRAQLVREDIYPAVLWKIDVDRAAGTPQAHADLSRRILCVHCDHRYDPADMQRVAAAVVRSLGAA